MSATQDTPQPLLIHLLRDAGAAVRLFDMGRRISKLSPDRFEKIERAQVPYPEPFLHHAWLGILIWNPKARHENAIWFLKMPLDEQGYLVQAARDDLVARLLQNAVNHQQGVLEEDALKDNPFAFKPDQEKMAMFHALAAQAMGNHASPYYEDAEAYLRGQLPLERWTDLGLQGLADFIVRLDQGDHARVLAARIDELPLPALASIATLLEHCAIPLAVRDALARRLDQLLAADTAEPLIIAALVRGLSNCADETFKQQQVLKVLHSAHALEAEVIVAIATRATSTLQAPEVLQPFLEQLAAGKAGQAGFSRVLADLMFMPALRALILHAFRNPDRSAQLSRAIGEMFGQHFE